uniref:Helicase C-terminal domain-containing protein n=1 Tax=Panagrellus redivivus TaxID=6233 RepID=A0A7E4ZSG7_PANRE
MNSRRFENWADFEREHEDPDHRGISALHKKLEPYLLRRVKKDVEKSLPAKVEQILRVDMTAQQKQYYKWILTKNYQELSKGVKGSINGFVNLIMELKKCCNHCSLVRQYDHFAKDTQSRLQQLLKSSGKLILLDKLLCRLKETGHRVLIFSQMVMMLDLLQEYMKLRRFTTQRLDGSMRSDLRKQALDHFNAPGSTDFCFLLSTRAGGLGINLATADTVIIFDSDWNPQNDLQAMSRAHRIGQKKQVNIYRFVTKASVEEEIVERAKKKLVLDHLVIQRMDTTGKTVLSKNAVASTKVPFDKADLNAILKFGAEELFREKEGEEQEPEVDIDDILTRAETRECENTANDNELLSAFKYANFALDEEKDLAALRSNVSKDGTASSSQPQPEKEWDDIIPEEQLEKLREEERQKALQELNLGPRQRTKVVDTENGLPEGSEDDADSSDDEDAGRAGKRGPYKRKVLFNFTDAEMKRFAKALKKFSHPLERLDAIAADAELEDHSTAEINELVIEVMRRLNEAAATAVQNGVTAATNGKKKPDRGPIVKIGGTDIYVRPILKQHNELEVLHQFMEKAHPPYELPVSPKGQFDWDVEWTDVDDSSILRGIHKYGVGNWEAIKMDPDFGLADKIWLKDKVKKPQPKHLQTRLEYLLRLLRKHYGTTDVLKPPRKRARMIEKPAKVKSEHDGGKKSKKENKKDDKKSKDHHHHHDRDHRSKHASSPTADRDVKREPKDIRSRIAAIVISDAYGKDLDNQKGDTFKKCVDNFRPVQKYIRKLTESKGKDDNTYDRSLVKLGDHITKTVEDMNASVSISSEQTRWHNYMWIFLSRFTGHSHNELVKAYAAKMASKSHHHHHKDKEHGDKKVKATTSPTMSHHKDHRDRDFDRRPTSKPDLKRDHRDNRHHHHNNVNPSRFQGPSTSGHLGGSGSGDRSYRDNRDRDRNDRDRNDRDRDRDHHHSYHNYHQAKDTPPSRASNTSLFPYNSPLLGATSSGPSTSTSTSTTARSAPRSSSRWGPAPEAAASLPPPPMPPSSFDSPSAAKVSRFGPR